MQIDSRTYSRANLPLLRVVLLAGLLANGSSAIAHGGEDHGAAAPAAAAQPGVTASTLTTHGATELFELLVKYPAVEAGDDTRLRFFLADFASNRPLEGARFKIAFKPAGVSMAGSPTMVSPGIYDLVARFPRDTVYTMVATVTAGGRTDFVEVRNIYAGEAAETFLAEHGGAGTPAQFAAGRSLLIPISIGLGLLAIVMTGVLLLRRRKTLASRDAAVINVAHDPDSNE